MGITDLLYIHTEQGPLPVEKYLETFFNKFKIKSSSKNDMLINTASK